MSVRVSVTDAAIEGRALDVSAAGMFVKTDQPVEIGSPCQILLNSYLSREPMRIDCRIARAGDKPSPGIGVEFVESGASAHKALSQYVARYQVEQRVVMVDDDAAVVRMVDRVLARSGVSLVGMDLAPQSAQELARFQPSLVILDIMMPEVTGIDVARMLRASSETTDIPVIFYSASMRSRIPDDLADIPFVSKGASYKEVVNQVLGLLPPQGPQPSL